MKTEDKLKIAWISDFPVEWLDDVPEVALQLPLQHPLAWLRVLLEEMEKISWVELHIFILRKQIKQNATFKRHGVVFHLIKTPAYVRAPSFFWLDTVLLRRELGKIQPNLVHAIGTERGAALVATRLPYPFLITIQGLLTWIKETVPVPLHTTLTAFLEQYSLRKAHFVSAESKFPANYLRARYPHVQVEQIEHVPHLRFHQIKRNPQLTPLRFIFVGTYGHAKGTDLLFRALNALRAEIEFELLVLGNGDANFLQGIKHQVSPALWQRIHLKGIQNSSQVADELSRCTMMIYPTRVDTGPVAVKEAVVAGVPVVGSMIGGIPDYVVSGKNGVLFSSGDLEQCVTAIRQACQHPLFSKGMVDQGVLSEKRHYLSPPLAAAKFLNLYRKIHLANKF